MRGAFGNSHRPTSPSHIMADDLGQVSPFVKIRKNTSGNERRPRAGNDARKSTSSNTRVSFLCESGRVPEVWISGERPVEAKRKDKKKNRSLREFHDAKAERRDDQVRLHHCSPDY